MGVKPVVGKPGFEAVEIAPTFHGLEHVEGMFPTSKGDLTVKWKKHDGVVDVEVIMPPGINEGTFKVPTLGGKECSRVETRNQPVAGLQNAFALKHGSNTFVIEY
jgi:hypothetical protein